MNKQIEDFINKVKTFRGVTGLSLNSENPNMDTHRQVIMEEVEEAADALADTIVTCLGLYLDTQDSCKKTEMIYMAQNSIRAAALLGFDINKVMDKVQAANMSKVCPSMDVAKQTKKYYHSIGVEAYIRDMPNGSFAVFSSEDQKGSNGKNFPAHKLLKSIEWFEPDYSDAKEWVIDHQFLDALEIK